MITPDLDKSWMGVTVKLRGTLVGDQNRVTVHYEHRLLSLYGREETINLKADAAPFKQQDFERYWANHKEFPLKTRKVTIAEMVPDGFTVVKRTEGTSDKCEYVLVTVERIDSAGQPIRQREDR